MGTAKDDIEFVLLAILHWVGIFIQQIIIFFIYGKCDWCGKKRFGRQLLLHSDDGWMAVCKKCEEEIE